MRLDGRDRKIGANSRIDKIAECGQLGKLYAPGNPTAIDGCLATSGALTIVTASSNNGKWGHSQPAATRDANITNNWSATSSSAALRTATCPAGTKVIGGSCDMFRGGDGRVVSPQACHISGNGFICDEGNTGYCVAHAVCAQQ